MANDKTKVAAGKPKITGAIYWAPAGTTLPTDASTALGSAFKCLGYASEDGVKNKTDRSRKEIKAWGGDTVMLLDEETKDTFTYTLIECMNEDVLKHVYGSSNVSSASGTITIDVVDMMQAEEGVIVIDQILKSALKRIIIPAGAVQEVGEVNYVDNDVIGYETTVLCEPVVMDGKKVYHREIIETGSTTTTTTT